MRMPFFELPEFDVQVEYLDGDTLPPDVVETLEKQSAMHAEAPDDDFWSQLSHNMR